MPVNTLDHFGLLGANAVPVGDRVGFIGMAGAVDKIFIGGQAHPGFGSVTAGGKERRHPAKILVCATLHLCLNQTRQGFLPPRQDVVAREE